MAAAVEAMDGLVPSWIGDRRLGHGPVRHDIVKAGDPPIRRGLRHDGGIQRTGIAATGAAVGVRQIGNPPRIGDAFDIIRLEGGRIGIGGRAPGWIRHAPQPGKHIGHRHTFIGIGDGAAQGVGDLADATAAVLERQGAAAGLKDLLNLRAVSDDRHGVAGAIGDRREKALAVESPDGALFVPERAGPVLVSQADPAGQERRALATIGAIRLQREILPAEPKDIRQRLAIPPDLHAVIVVHQRGVRAEGAGVNKFSCRRNWN